MYKTTLKPYTLSPCGGGVINVFGFYPLLQMRPLHVLLHTLFSTMETENHIRDRRFIFFVNSIINKKYHYFSVGALVNSKKNRTVDFLMMFTYFHFVLVSKTIVFAHVISKWRARGRLPRRVFFFKFLIRFDFNFNQRGPRRRRPNTNRNTIAIVTNYIRLCTTRRRLKPSDVL